MEFRLLGPLEVLDSGQPLVLGGAKQRALLALLLLNANHVVSVDRIVDELWGESPPGSAANAIQVYVANLRKVLQPGRVQGAASEVIVTRAPGYLIRISQDDVDLLRFEQLTDEARQRLSTDPERATARLRQALALWRGPALADIMFEGPARGEITRLEELRLSALEDRIQGDLDLGRHASLVGELEALVVSHPVRERLHAQRMVAMYRCGRQADALKAYREARRMLADELGIDPCAELQSLERAILQQDPALAPPPRAVPAPREEQLAATLDADPGKAHRMEEPPAPQDASRLVSQPTLAWRPPLPDQQEVPAASQQQQPQVLQEAPGGSQQEQLQVPHYPSPVQPAAPPATAAAPPAREEIAAAATAELGVGRVGGAPAPPRRRLRLLAAGAVVLLLGSFGGVVLHSRSGSSPSSGPGPSATQGTAPVAAAYPTATEKQLLTLFPPLIDQSSCHRYAKHYGPAIAEVECQTGSAHPGIKSIVYQEFASYGDLELHFHHVLALDIQADAGQSLTKANLLPCALDPTFFALSTYPIGAEAQDPQSSPYAHGHFFCYLTKNGVPKLAWTNVGRLIAAQAEGDGTGTSVQSNLLASWQFAGPVGALSPPAAAITTQDQARYLYKRYLSRDPESPEVLAFHASRIALLGFAGAVNDFADSGEAKERFTVPALLHH